MKKYTIYTIKHSAFEICGETDNAEESIQIYNTSRNEGGLRVVNNETGETIFEDRREPVAEITIAKDSSFINEYVYNLDYLDVCASIYAADNHGAKITTKIL